MNRSIALSFVLLASCATLPRVPAAYTPPEMQRVAAVIVESTCADDGPFGGISWIPDRLGSGVIVSERHVLTALHVVSCPALPDVHVTLLDGRRFRMVVDREGDSGEDAALLEVASAERFGLGVSPPVISGPAYFDFPCVVTAFPTRHDVCGPTVGLDTIEASVVPGNSGAGVYDRFGGLLGLVTTSDGRYTRFQPVPASWLEFLILPGRN